MQTFTILRETSLPAYTQKILGRRVFTKQYEITHNLPTVIDVQKEHDRVTELYEQLVMDQMQEANDDDYISVTIKHEMLHLGNISKPIYMGQVQKKNFDPSKLVQKLGLVSQSNSFLEDKLLTIEVATIRNMRWGGRYQKCGAPVLAQNLYEKKHSIYNMAPKDPNSCVYWAIVFGMEYHENRNITNTGFKDIKAWDVFRKNRRDRISKAAKNLCKKCQINYNEPCTLITLRKIQNIIKGNYQIIMFERPQRLDRQPYIPLFKGPPSKKIILLESISRSGYGHVNFFTSLNSYFETNAFCTSCFKRNEHRTHVCTEGNCKHCRTIPPCTAQEPVTCSQCNRQFNGQNCYDQHIINKLCGNRIKCKDCDDEYSTRYPHRCFTSYCFKCNEHYDSYPHNCYVKPIPITDLINQDDQLRVIITLDIETRQDTVDARGRHVHIPTLLCTRTHCQECFDDESLTKKIDVCKTCGHLDRAWTGKDCVFEFGEWLYKDIAKRIPKKGRIYVVAHNLSRFDGRFLLRDLYDKKYLNTELILNGNQIMKIDVGNIRFIDSFLLFQMPLSALPSAFGFEDQKGYFPYLFDTLENARQGDIDIPLPDSKYYNVGYMKENEVKKFYLWYNQQIKEGATFNLNRDRLLYCTGDVRILSCAFATFRRTFKKITCYDPIARKFTLASLALEFFKTILTPKTIGITPVGGYDSRKGSIPANAWLDLIQIKENILIEREQKVGPFWVDGYHRTTKTVFEFWGCYFHQCPLCFPEKSIDPKIERKRNYFRDKGFKLREIWEHTFKNCSLFGDIDYIKQRTNHYRAIKNVTSADLRSAFFGGRTGFTKLYHECQDGERIRYIDVLSLYPTVLYECNFPLGHPKIINEFSNHNIDEYFGFISCRVLPPTRLRIPVLPIRINNKLVFPLCFTCSKNQKKTKCTHPNHMRCINGMWTSIEIQEALKAGYTIDKLYEVYHYDKQSSELFKEYIRKWIKMKQENSGWPKYCMNNDEEKMKYLSSWFRLGVILDASQIRENPGMRTIAKLMLNTLWGKFGEAPNKPQTKICRSAEEILTIMEDKNIEVLGEFEVGQDCLQISYKQKDSKDANNIDKSVALAAFVTSHARLKLLKAMQKIEEKEEGRVLYYDTDSIMYVEKSGEDLYPTGNTLGEMTDEILAMTSDPSCYIKRAVFAAPKSYAFQVVNSAGEVVKTILKTRGITRHAKASAVLNYDSYQTVVHDFIHGNETTLDVPQCTLKSSKRQHIYTIENTKKMRVVADKRVPLPLSNDTLAYGDHDIP